MTTVITADTVRTVAPTDVRALAKTMTRRRRTGRSPDAKAPRASDGQDAHQPEEEQ
jgi:hypothetical protein